MPTPAYVFQAITPAALAHDRDLWTNTLDDLGEVVVRMGGEVHVLPAARMAGRNSVAATFRY